MFNTPLTPLAQSFASIHEIFTSAVEAGFTEPQAMEIVLKVVETGIILGSTKGSE